MSRICVVGYGYWGPNIVRNLVNSDACDTPAVCDANPARLEKAGKEYPGVRLIGDFAEVLDGDGFDGVVVATPVSTHYPLARAALLAGKHVAVEKPMSTRLVQAEELVAIAERKRLTLMSEHTYVYHPAVRKMREIIVKGEIGNIQYIDSTRVNLGLFQRDVNVIWDLAVHDLAITAYLTGQWPASVQAIGQSHTPSGLQNMGQLVLRYESGLFTHINCSWISPVKIRNMQIGGDKKMIVYNDLDANEPVKIYDSGFVARSSEEIADLRIQYRIGDIWTPRIPRGEALAASMADFLEAIDKRRPPESDGVFGARIVRILEAAQVSIDSHGAEIVMPADA